MRISDLEVKPLESGRLKDNFLRWLFRSYPTDFEIYASRPGVSENEIWEFLKGDGYVQYLLPHRVLQGGII